MATTMTLPNIMSKSLIEHTFEGAWNNTLNSRPAFMALKERGHIDYGIAGDKLRWNVRGGRHQITSYNDMDDFAIARQDLKFNCELPWAFYSTADAITTDEMSLMANKEAFSKRQRELVNDMVENFESRLSSEFINSDGGTGSTNILHGLETFFAATGSSLTKLGTAGDIYATQSTALNGITGLAQVESDAWTPNIINIGTTATTALATWTNAGGFTIANALEIFEFAYVQAQKGGTGKTNTPDLGLFSRTHFGILRSALIAQQRGVIDGLPKGAQGIGVPGAVYVSGTEIVMDNDVTDTAGAQRSYLLNFHHMWLEVLPVPSVEGLVSAEGVKPGAKKKMFEVNTDVNIGQNALRVRVNCRLQLRANPRYQTKFVGLA